MGIQSALSRFDIVSDSSVASAHENALFAKASPPVSEQEAGNISRSVFGVDGIATLLTGERDLNFLISRADGKGFVLKVTHPSEAPGVTDFQTKAQLHVLQQDAEVPVPQIYPMTTGEYIHWRKVPETDKSQAVRLISFVEGVPLHKTSPSRNQRHAVGVALARFDMALTHFVHPQMDHKLIWDVQHLEDLRDLLPYIDDHRKRDLASATLRRIVEDILPIASGLRPQVIHNDLNAYNVMVGSSDTSNVCGLLDFGDMVYAPLVQDLAVACAYQLSSNLNPLDTALECVLAYHAVNPLSRAELSVLPDLIAARLLATVLITGWRAMQHPENSTYILRNNPLSWDGLLRLAEHPPSVHRQFFIDNVL